MDQTTQQNAALVEQTAAAAATLRDQADKLEEVVSAFRINSSYAPPAARTVATVTPLAKAPRAKPAPKPASQRLKAAAASSNEWEEF
jgi:methyl-accepting chemotaxis protein